MVRNIAGDRLLIVAIKSIKNQKNGMEGFKSVEHGRQHVLNVEKVHSKNDFTSSLKGENSMEVLKNAEHIPQPVLVSENVHKNEFTSFLNETTIIGPLGLQGQSPLGPKPIDSQ